MDEAFGMGVFNHDVFILSCPKTVKTVLLFLGLAPPRHE
jgi:hypothetical protein